MTKTGQDDFRESFFQECDELLETLHDGFDQMVQDNHDAETIHAVFRAVHSIKGGAAAFGLDALVGFAHTFETGLDTVRSGEVDVDPEILDLFQRCGDHLSDQVAAARGDLTIDTAKTDALCGKLLETVGASGPEAQEPEPDFVPQTLSLDMFGAVHDEVVGDQSEPNDTAPGLSFSFKGDQSLFSSGNEPAILFRALERYGAVSIATDLADVPALTELDPSQPVVVWTIHIDGDVSEDAVGEVFEFVSDCCTIEFHVPDEDAMTDQPKVLSATTSNVAIAPTPPEIEKPVAPAMAKGAAPSPAAEKPATEAASRARGGATIRVDLDRVDKLINLVGELVIKEAILSQSVAELQLPSESQVSASLESLKQLASDIQEGVMAIRAQPVKPIFQRMARTVRDASLATGKRVRLITQGEGTEVDKTVLERLVDPLTHMVRNAVDHGLEDTEARLAAGKPAEGIVTLSAAHRSGRVVIEVSDNGGGINREKVRQLAEEKGLVTPGAELSASEIDNLLFMPGFSSKEEVSELSGRGVGLDVARSEILALGGRLSIQSEPGKGSCFSISLPLTLAVLEGMVVDVAGQTMVVPITAIHETLQPKSDSLHTIGTGARVLSTREGLVPIVDLGAAFGFRSMPASLDDHVLLLVETESHRRCALLVDSIHDQRQVVIKSLETNYQRINGVAAATILGNGRIALIIDPDNIVSDAQGSASSVQAQPQ
jgi:two-component system chemotaxis sensor kinase CheA